MESTAFSCIRGKGERVSARSWSAAPWLIFPPTSASGAPITTVLPSIATAPPKQKLSISGGQMPEPSRQPRHTTQSEQKAKHVDPSRRNEAGACSGAIRGGTLAGEKAPRFRCSGSSPAPHQLPIARTCVTLGPLLDSAFQARPFLWAAPQGRSFPGTAGPTG